MPLNIKLNSAAISASVALFSLKVCVKVCVKQYGRPMAARKVLH